MLREQGLITDHPLQVQAENGSETEFILASLIS